MSFYIYVNSIFISVSCSINVFLPLRAWENVTQLQYFNGFVHGKPNGAKEIFMKSM